MIRIATNVLAGKMALHWGKSVAGMGIKGGVSVASAGDCRGQFSPKGRLLWPKLGWFPVSQSFVSENRLKYGDNLQFYDV